MTNEREKIQDMLADGRMTESEAQHHFEALERNAERPAIDIGSGTDAPHDVPQPTWWEGIKAEYWRKEHLSSYVMLAPGLILMVGSILLLAVGVAAGLVVVVLAIPALLIQGLWNGVLAQSARQISLVEAYGIALVMAILAQGLRRWRR